MHIHTPYSTTITAFYVEINYEIGENSFDSVGFMDICSKINLCFIHFHVIFFALLLLIEL